MIAMQIDRATLQRWLKELSEADENLSSIPAYTGNFTIADARSIANAQRHIWFVVGQIKSLLTEE